MAENKTVHPLLQFLDKSIGLAELHAHLGSSGNPALLWDLAHQSGLRLPVKDYWEFADLMTVHKVEGKDDVERLNRYVTFFDLTEQIQSSPMAMERVIYDAIGGAYRSNNITTLELRFDPMLRNREGEHDLDHVILASLAGLDRAVLAFPKVKAGLIFELDRRFDFRMNEIIVKKAIRYKNRGVVGIDIAGPRKGTFNYLDYQKLYELATENGLGTTIHTGEDGTAEEMKEVVEHFPLKRIGHGVKAAWDKELMTMLKEKDITLEICPTSNLTVGIIKDIVELKFVIRTFIDHGVKFTINTDGPEFFQTSLLNEYLLLLENEILTPEEILKVNQTAHHASFIANSDYYKLSPLTD